MNYPVVGAFVLALGAVLIAGVLWIASGGAFRQQYDLYRAIEDESVSGLNLNAPVKYNGVDVGKVREIRLDPGNPERVNLLLAIERGTPINVDTVAVLKTQGLTGIVSVELRGGSRSSPPLRAAKGSRYPVIRTEPSLSARLENVLTSALSKLDTASNTVSAILSERNQTAFANVLADLATVTHTIAARREALDAVMVDAARTLENASRASAQLGPVIERLEPAIARLGPVIERIEPVVERIGRGADSVEKMGHEIALAGARAGETVDSVGADVQRFSGETLPELERLLGELHLLSTSLRSLIEQTERDPRGLLFGHKPVPAGPGE